MAACPLSLIIVNELTMAYNVFHLPQGGVKFFDLFFKVLSQKGTFQFERWRDKARFRSEFLIVENNSFRDLISLQDFRLTTDLLRNALSEVSIDKEVRFSQNLKNTS